MKILLVETARLNQGTTIAHLRNSFEIARSLTHSGIECDLADIFGEFPDKQYDIILFSYASGFADFTNVEAFLSTQERYRVGWITNEFELFANDFVKKRMDFMITNFDEAAIKKAHTHKDLLVTNLNALMYNGRNKEFVKKYDTCYYGTYRKYRIPYFQKYLQSDVILSTAKKNMKDFIDAGIDCDVTEPFDWTGGWETLNMFKASLYIEDTKTHQWFNHMANRFFEGLNCNCPCFFDKSCLNTIKRDIFPIDPYFIVDGVEELLQKSRNPDKEKVEIYLKVNGLLAEIEKTRCIMEIGRFLTQLNIP